MRKKSNSTIKDVARLADASIATVSRVLNNTDYPVSEMTRKRILEAAKELKYMPNGLSKARKTAAGMKLG
ncbi:MAG TPA: LacI family DNA-binding transcriptional regulator [Candidatus Ruthenibacterium merdavium]|uniref:LacI family DNA-binding transcriptional regulator n=1 Tax=Candidatus Ruthenibacterium merdavium TaxID=2838752 RepID=A0A9D2TJ42_9FIRM|nr:LacI family DNA-binding transcriptional regulator [Candidatus Ruthenibacterium merdavium]